MKSNKNQLKFKESFINLKPKLVSICKYWFLFYKLKILILSIHKIYLLFDKYNKNLQTILKKIKKRDFVKI